MTMSEADIKETQEKYVAICNNLNGLCKITEDADNHILASIHVIVVALNLMIKKQDKQSLQIIRICTRMILNDINVPIELTDKCAAICLQIEWKHFPTLVEALTNNTILEFINNFKLKDTSVFFVAGLEANS